MGKKSEIATPVAVSGNGPVLKNEPEGAGNGTVKAPAAPVAPKPTAKIPAKAAPKKKAAPKTVTFSTEDIALRAYFISEHRHRNGIHGDSHTDWITAEKQLRAESRRKAAKKKKTSVSKKRA